MQTLHLEGNQLSSLPAEIGQLSNLQTLYLRSNQLSSLPAEIRKLTKLKKLDLRRNPVPVPPEILGPKDLSRDPGDVNEILDFYFRSYLHDLGVCLHFQDDSTLKNWVILKPEWATTAVYKVLDNKTVKQNLGCFTQEQLADI